MTQSGVLPPGGSSQDLQTSTANTSDPASGGSNVSVSQPATANISDAQPAGSNISVSQPTPSDLTQDLKFSELAAFLPPGTIESNADGLVLKLHSLTDAVMPDQYGVSQFLYDLIAAAGNAQQMVNAGRLAQKPLTAIQNGYTELRGQTVRFAVTLNGYADLSSNLNNVRGGQ